MFSLYFDQHTSDSQLLLSNGVDGFQWNIVITSVYNTLPSAYFEKLYMQWVCGH